MGSLAEYFSMGIWLTEFSLPVSTTECSLDSFAHARALVSSTYKIIDILLRTLGLETQATLCTVGAVAWKLCLEHVSSGAITMAYRL